MQGTAGLMTLTGEPGGPPIKFGIPIGDIGAGMFAVHAVLAALHERDRTGTGAYLDVAMQDSMVALLTYQAGRYFMTGVTPLPEGNQHPIIVPYGTFRAADGYLNIGVGNDSQWRRFCVVIGAPELGADPRYATNAQRRAAREEINAAVAARVVDCNSAELLAALDDSGIPAGAIRDLEQVFADPTLQARGARVRVQHPTAGELSVTGPPWHIDGSPSPIRRPPPTLGEHTEEVLRELAGYTPAEVEKCRPSPRL